MLTHKLKQGTPEWAAYRTTHDNASDAPAMMGCSPYKTRTELLLERFTGITREIAPSVQALFDAGHRFEALARDRADAIVGEPLYPVTGSLGNLSASFDGLTMLNDIAWEHKTINDGIRAAKSAADLGLHYRVQMEQQMLVSGAEKVLFHATRWGDATEPLEELYFWYEGDAALREQIIAGWEQFKADLAAYEIAPAEEVKKAAAVRDLPVVTVQVRGELAMCNLAEITPLFDAFLAEAKTDLKTDDDFALAEEQAKKGRIAAKQCKMTAKAVVDQMQSIATVTSKLEEYAAKFDAMALRQEKAVKEQKEARRTAAKLERDASYTAHVAALNKELHPILLIVADKDKPQFAEVMKNQRTLASLYNKLDTELARVKIAADAIAKDIRAKRTWHNEAANGFEHLFADLSSLIYKQMDDFQLAVTSRIDAHKAAEAAKAERERARIREEERVKAEAAAAELLRQQQAEAARATAQREAEERARAAADTQRQLDEEAARIAAERAAEPAPAPGAMCTAPARAAQLQTLAEQHLADGRATAQAERAAGLPTGSLRAAGDSLFDAITDAGPTDEAIIAFGAEHDIDLDELIPRLERFIADVRAGRVLVAA